MALLGRLRRGALLEGVTRGRLPGFLLGREPKPTLLRVAVLFITAEDKITIQRSTVCLRGAQTWNSCCVGPQPLECWNYRRQSTVPALLGFLILIFFWFLSNAFWFSRFSHHFEMSSISDVYKYKFNIFNFFKVRSCLVAVDGVDASAS